MIIKALFVITLQTLILLLTLPVSVVASDYSFGARDVGTPTVDGGIRVALTPSRLRTGLHFLS